MINTSSSLNKNRKKSQKPVDGLTAATWIVRNTASCNKHVFNTAETFSYYDTECENLTVPHFFQEIHVWLIDWFW